MVIISIQIQLIEEKEGNIGAIGWLLTSKCMTVNVAL